MRIDKFLRYLAIFLFGCVLGLMCSQAVDAQPVDRPWVKRSTSGYNDTIYHTVVAVTTRPAEEITWVYRYAVDSIPHGVIAPDVIYQVDSNRMIYAGIPATPLGVVIDSIRWDTTSTNWIISKHYQKTHIHKRQKKPRRTYSSLAWTTDPGKGKTTRIRIKIFWGAELPDGRWLEASGFNGTLKQWDSIGREYILHKKYFQ